MTTQTNWEHLAAQEKRYYDLYMATRVENDRFRAALRDIASFYPIPTPQVAFEQCVETAKNALNPKPAAAEF